MVNHLNIVSIELLYYLNKNSQADFVIGGVYSTYNSDRYINVENYYNWNKLSKSDLKKVNDYYTHLGLGIKVCNKWISHIEDILNKENVKNQLTQIRKVNTQYKLTISSLKKSPPHPDNKKDDDHDVEDSKKSF